MSRVKHEQQFAKGVLSKNVLKRLVSLRGVCGRVSFLLVVIQTASGLSVLHSTAAFSFSCVFCDFLGGCV